MDADRPSQAIDRLEARARKQTRWFMVMLAVAVFLGVLSVRQDSSQRDLIRLLTRRTPIIEHIEAATDQQVCADEIEAAYQEATTRLLVALVDGDRGAATRLRPDLETVLDLVKRIEDICPPVNVAEENP